MTKALIDLPMSEVRMFFELNASYSNASEPERGQKFYDLLTFTYAKCGYSLTKALIDKYCDDDVMAKAIILAGVIKLTNCPA
jgi:hypothetical protein